MDLYNVSMIDLDLLQVWNMLRTQTAFFLDLSQMALSTGNFVLNVTYILNFRNFICAADVCERHSRINVLICVCN